MINLEKLIQKAHGLFLSREYDKALFLYSQVLSLEPLNIEYQLYPVLCDISSEDEEKAQSLFQYFYVQKDMDLGKAIKYIEDSIGAFDGDNELMIKLMDDVSTTSIEGLDAIEYEDFKELINARGSFRIAYEDIMFSTKVAIKSKDDLVDFIKQLIDNDFDTTAYSYLDGFNEVFSYDKELTDLYEKLESKALAVKN
jgi:tetratricopeptide (TPR) repeat protein